MSVTPSGQTNKDRSDVRFKYPLARFSFEVRTFDLSPATPVPCDVPRTKTGPQQAGFLQSEAVRKQAQNCGRPKGVGFMASESVQKISSEQRFIKECRCSSPEKTLPEKKWKTVSTYSENESLSSSIASVETGPLRAFLPNPKCNPTVGS